MTDLTPGTRVSFADANATVSDNLVGIREGIVNGLPITDASGITYVPIYAKCSRRREATTIWVAAPNILGPVNDRHL